MSRINKIIYCQRSGVPLIETSTLCSNSWALMSEPLFSTLVHPIYDVPLERLLRKLARQLEDAAALDWELDQYVVREIGLSMSAIMYSLNTMWLPTAAAVTNGRNIESSLPDQKTTVGCAARLLDLAGWYHHETSKRIAFPLWKPSRNAGNLNWHGFPAWLDACFDIKEEWAKVKRKTESVELTRAVEDALDTVHMSSVYKRIDVAKVWNWVEMQASHFSIHYPAGRRETLKTLFMTGELNPEDWIADDCDDLIEMVTSTCDIGNDITHFIRTRVSHIRAAINDFYSNFTLIGKSSADGDGGLELSEKEQECNTALFKEYDEKLANLTELPAKPTADKYPSKIHFLRAQAEWNILARRFASRNPK